MPITKPALPTAAMVYDSAMPKPRRPRDNEAQTPMVRTTLLIPEGLWLLAKHRAAVERRALRDLLIEGLAMRLAQPPSAPGSNDSSGNADTRGNR